MSTWKSVGEWLKANAGHTVGLVGGLLTGNAPMAVAAGAALVSSATGTTDPAEALARLQADPATLVRLKELQLQNEADIRAHTQRMLELELADKQAEHHETQATIRSGDNAEDTFVRRTRPGQAWVALFAALGYVFSRESPDWDILMALLALPLVYAGLREVGKFMPGVSAALAARGVRK